MTRSAALGVLLPGFEGTALPGWLRERLADGLAGVCLFATNIAAPSQVRELTDAIREANPRAVIAVDEEGGDVTRLHQRTGSPYPGNAILGRIDDLELTRRVGETVGRELAAAGITLDFAPDADINSDDRNPVIGTRSFGADPGLVSRHTVAWIEGLQSTGVAASAKHFPGHGDTASDSHLAMPVVDLPLEALRARELLPFAAAVGAGARSVMTSHILLPQLDGDNVATFSPRILGELLRGDLGFTGAIVTDALDMRGASGGIGMATAAVRALAAGADLLCLGTANTAEQVDGLAAAISARVAASRIAEALGRVAPLGVLPPVVPSPAPAFDVDRTIGAFDIAAGVTVRPERLLVQLETGSNIAVGVSPWGPAAAGVEVVRVREGDALPSPGAAQLVIVGRDNHRRAWTRDVIDAARASGRDVLVVDMGCPSADRRYADVATFGASAHAGAALLRLLDRLGRGASTRPARRGTRRR
ncbi:glycoside hydrolase family 3 protein [Pseudolysinimonas kribbensis]|uniref:Sugar hydrolase n=1 Tax=Pseudolysinimonas kribbensis TaxID=433641 RepID=A0ABQ6K7S4_9MICO|nr:glycoside hydrolase family 3 N-terminal domain-containing protein [Pseudolysinimonas kribbensis]GMA95791.1 sugar hydrolase [Pseudolysinimonas kribbensis]